MAVATKKEKAKQDATTQQEARRRIERACADPVEFVKLCWPDMLLYEKQRDILRSVRDNIETFVHAANSVGKCLEIDERIILWDGSVRRVGDLLDQFFIVPAYRQGEQVPQVAYAEHNGYEQVARITTQHGRSVVRTLNHPLLAADLAVGFPRFSDRTPFDPRWRPISEIKVGDLVAVPMQLDCVGTAHATEEEVKLIAYLIGDGSVSSKSAVGFTQEEGVVKDEFRSIVESFGGQCKATSKIDVRVTGDGLRPGHAGVNPILNLSRDWGIHGKKSKEKFFTDRIWRLPNDQLALLLNRIFACDGWATSNEKNKRAQVGIALASERLIRDIEIAALRLGIVGSVRHCMVDKKFNAWEWSLRDRENIAKFAEVVGIFGKEDALNEAVRVSALWDGSRQRTWQHQRLPHGYRWEKVKSIEHLGMRETVAVGVKDDNTFVTTMVEHNTHVAALVAIVFFLTRTPARVLITSSDYGQLTTALWPQIKHLIDTSVVPLPLNVTHLHVRKVKEDGTFESLDYLRGFSPDRPETFQGQHLPYDRPRTLVIIDEASGIDDFIKVTSETFAHRTLVIGNPMTTTNFFYRCCRGGDVEDPAGKANLLRKVIHIQGMDSPNVQLGMELERRGIDRDSQLIPGLLTLEEYRRRDAEWNEVEKTVRLHGQFYEGAQQLLYPLTWLENSYAEHGKLGGLKRTPTAMGIDAGEGRDLTVWTLVDEHGVVEQISAKTPNPMETVGRTIQLINQHSISASNVCFDSGHGGNACVHRLKEQGYNVRGVAFGSAPSPLRDPKSPQRKDTVRVDRTAYKNRRAEMYGRLRELLDPNHDRPAFALPPDVHELHEELVAMPLQYDSEGKMFLPPKDRTTAKATGQISLRDILGRSPDRADSLVLAVFALTEMSSFTMISEDMKEFDPALARDLTDGLDKEIRELMYTLR